MSYKAGIIEAIQELKDRNGSSMIAIKKFMQSKLPQDKQWQNGTFLSALKSAVAAGELVQVKNSYKLSADFKKKIAKPAAKAAPKKTTAVKKTATKKATATKKTAPKKKATTAKKAAAPKKEATKAKAAPKKKATTAKPKAAPKKKATTAKAKAAPKKKAAAKPKAAEK